MGTWGPGNFENDTAAEHLIQLCNPLVEQIRNAVANPSLMEAGEDDSDVLVANIEILAILGGNIGRIENGELGGLIFPFRLPPPEEVESWKRGLECLGAVH